MPTLLYFNPLFILLLFKATPKKTEHFIARPRSTKQQPVDT